jgi:hypothetical protein
MLNSARHVFDSRATSATLRRGRCGPNSRLTAGFKSAVIIAALSVIVGCTLKGHQDQKAIKDSVPEDFRLVGQRTDSAIAHLVGQWTLSDFTPQHQWLSSSDASLILYNRAGRVCYVKLVSSPETAYDPERADVMFVTTQHEVSDAYAEWLGHLIAKLGMPVASDANSASWGGVHVEHGKKWLHSFVGRAEGCLEPSDHADVLDK